MCEPNLDLETVVLFSPGYALLDEPISSNTRVFISYGRQDEKIQFSEAEELLDSLRRIGYPVLWFPFEGGHTLTPEVLEATQTFLLGSSR